MNAVFLMKAFFTGFFAALALGPVFIMTFNRAALHGMHLGVATAFGAACTDGLLFFLVMSGVLGKFVIGQTILVSLDLVGAVALVLLSWHYWKTVQDVHERVSGISFWQLIDVFFKTFVMTFLNPSATLFFVFISMKLFAAEFGSVSFFESILGGLAVTGGTCSALSLVSYGASFVGARLSAERLRKISRITAVFLVVIAIFLLIDAISLLLR